MLMRYFNVSSDRLLYFLFVNLFCEIGPSDGAAKGTYYNLATRSSGLLPLSLTFSITRCTKREAGW